ncbi:glycosyltransferase family 4 protein [Flavobacteriaceae bacterium]|nr:glycosyltransferase family 4 protein [Flavobacteriaceae bacterium]
MAKRVLIYTNHYFPEQFKINDVVDWLKGDDFKIRVVTGMPNYPSGVIYSGYGIFSKKSNQIKDNLIINRLPLIPRGSGSKLFIVINYLSYFISTLVFTFYLIFFKKKYDVVLVHHTSPFFISIAPIIYKIFRSSKNILWDLDIWPQTLEGMNIIKNKTLINSLEYIVKKIYKFYDEILITSRSLQNIINSRVDENHIHFFPNWADEKIESQKVINDIETEINHDFLNIMYMGNIGEAQDFDSVIKSVKKLKNIKTRLYIIGDGRYKSKFKELVNIGNLSSKIIFIEHQNLSNVYSYAIKSDFLFLSLKNEEIFKYTIPAKLQMYMSIGKPILAMISGEANNLINNSNVGIAVDSGDYIKLADEINNIYNNKYDIKKMALNSRETYDLNFKSSLRKEQIIKLIKSI